ncbi:hypothetical protein TRVL_06880 [Trypanosoma vivax]|nr:hypothetical protein TRVL_06880 [Trypanosoma vivax]
MSIRCLTLAAPLVSQTHLAAPVTGQKYNDLELSRHLHKQTAAVLDATSASSLPSSACLVYARWLQTVSVGSTCSRIFVLPTLSDVLVCLQWHISSSLRFLSCGWNRSCDIALHRKAGYATCSTYRDTHAQRVVLCPFVYARSNLEYENVALMRGCRCLFGARCKMREGNRNVSLPSSGCSCPQQFAGAQHRGRGALRVSEMVGTPQAADKRRTTQGKMQLPSATNSGLLCAHLIYFFLILIFYFFLESF